MLHVVNEVRVKPPCSLWVQFADGVEGEVDLSELIGHGVFRSLTDQGTFARVGIDEFGAVCWPDGPDLAPDAMYSALRTDGIWRPRLVAAGQRA
jgi:hypothetical protein